MTEEIFKMRMERIDAIRTELRELRGIEEDYQ